MVYKIVGNFDSQNFDRMLSKLMSKFIFMYLEDTLFLSIKSYKDLEEGQKLIKQTLKPSKDFYIQEINEKNIMKLSDVCTEWCKNNLIRLEQQRYEDEQQVHLREVWHAMDNMEQELQKLQKQQTTQQSQVTQEN